MASPLTFVICYASFIIGHSIPLSIQEAFEASEMGRQEMNQKVENFAYSDVRRFHNPEFFVYKKKIGYTPAPPAFVDGV